MIALGGIGFGLVLLIAGGAILVNGASQLARLLGLSPVLIGLTIVGFGTSAPELVVNLVSVHNGETALAFGNIVGSNIANFGLVLGIAALVAPIHIHGSLVRRELPLFLLATLMITVMSLDGLLRSQAAEIDRSDSILLLLLFCIFLYVLVQDVLRMRRPDRLFLDIEQNPVVITDIAARYWYLSLFAGFALLFIGGNVTVSSAVSLAESLQVSSAIVGLVAVAVGTSMPELITSIVAALRGESDLAVGNVVGSNIFNGLMVLPASGLIADIGVPDGGIQDLVASMAMAAILIPIFYFGNARLGRPMGLILLVSYVAYMAYRVAG